MTASETVGERLRRTRIERGLSQREMAARATIFEGKDLSYAYISRVEGGTRQPSVRVLRALAHVLDVTAHWLEFGHEYFCRECGAPVIFDPTTGE